MFQLTKRQRAIEDEIRVNFLANEAKMAGLDPRSVIEMEEADIVREMAYRPMLQGNAAPVPPEAWRRIDDEATLLQRDVLAVFAKLYGARNRPVGVGDIVNYYPKISGSGEVTRSMDGRHAGRGDQAQMKLEGTPVPVYTAETILGWRQMEVIRKGGMMIETESINNDQRNVAETLEDVVINGDSQVVVSGMQVYGLRNFPDRSTGTHGLTLASATGAQWLTAVKQIIDLLIADNSYGKVTIFLNWGDYTAASINEFTSGYPKTILQRLKEIEQVAEFVPASRMPANNLVGINNLASGSWGSMLTAMPMTTRPKMRMNPEDNYVWSTIAMSVPQFRSDYNARSHIAHTTTA